MTKDFKQKKDEKIKIWPEIIGLYPAIVPLSDIKNKKDNSILVQFAGLSESDSTGLSFLLCQLLKIFKKIDSRSFGFEDIQLIPTYETISKLGFFNIINKHLPYKDLFLSVPDAQLISKIEYIKEGFKKVSFPIYHLDYSIQQEPRHVVDDFIEWLSNILEEPIRLGFKFKRNAFVQMLNEIAKNSEDHTDDNAFFGIDFINLSSNNLKITFSFCDLGRGIHINIKEYLRDHPEAFNGRFRNKHNHLSLTDVYHIAMGVNNSCPKNDTGRNRGLGMSIIHQCSVDLGLKLSVFDANSRGLLSELTLMTHEDIRKYFFNLGKSTGFYYYGELTLVK